LKLFSGSWSDCHKNKVKQKLPFEALRLGTEATEYSLFYYAVAMHKEKAADLLLDPKIGQRKDPKLWRSYELARTAALPDVMSCILQHNQDKLSTETAKK
jgi:hypothetical protein